MYVGHVHVSGIMQGALKYVLDALELDYGCWEENLGPLIEHQVHLIAKPSPLAPAMLFFENHARNS